MSESNPIVAQSIKNIADACRTDPSYAWSWFCNLKMSMVDQGMSRPAAGHAAANFLMTLLGIDIRKNPNWRDELATVYLPITAQARELEIEPAHALARVFHNTYEAKSPQFGYETREETRQFDPNTPNGKLMIAVCEVVLSGRYALGIDHLRETKYYKDLALKLVELTEVATMGSFQIRYTSELDRQIVNTLIADQVNHGLNVSVRYAGGKTGSEVYFLHLDNIFPSC